MQLTNLTRSLAIALAVVFLAHGTPAEAKSDSGTSKQAGSKDSKESKSKAAKKSKSKAAKKSKSKAAKKSKSKAAKKSKSSKKSGSGAETRVTAPFLNTGIQPLAKGEIDFEGRAYRSGLEIELEDLDIGPLYSLLFNGVEWAAFYASSRGSAELQFESNPSRADRPMLPTDPRGGTLVVSDGTSDILTALVSGPGEPPGSQIRENGPFGLGSLPANARAESEFIVDRGGDAHYGVQVEKVPAGSYLMLVDGEVKAAPFVAKDGGRVKLDFSSPQGRSEFPLDFDPRESVVEIHGPTGMAASGGGSSSIEGLNECAESEVESPLDAVAGVGEGHSELKVDEDCDRSFEVEIEDVPAGAYDVYVDGILRGTLQAAFDATKGEVEGELEWETDPDDPDELLLDFDPEDALIEVKQGDTVFFSGIQMLPPPTLPGGGGSSCTEVETTVALTNVGVIPSAHGKAEFEVSDSCEEKFEVEIEDVPPGPYDVYVGGVLRGTLQAVFDPTEDEVEGELEWETDPDDPDELLLDFDPRGQTIEVFDGGTLIFERAFPS